MGDKLFFGEVEAKGKAAREAYMAARGPHAFQDDDKAQKKVEVKIDEMPGRVVRDGGY